MDKRDAILKAALDLFAERGYYGASVAQIAEKAQVGTGTIYRYFKDKDVLVNELYRLWKKKMSEALLTDLPEEMPPRQLFHVIWDRLKKFSRENLNVVKFLEFHHHAPYLDEESQRTCEELKMELHEFFELCRQAQITKEAPSRLLMGILIGAFIGLKKMFSEGELEPTPENDDLAEEICWETIRR